MDALSPIRNRESMARTPIGNAPGSIVTIADESEDALIVMGSRGASGVKRWLPGSVTDTVVRAPAHPVLVVPRGSD